MSEHASDILEFGGKIEGSLSDVDAELLATSINLKYNDRVDRGPDSPPGRIEFNAFYMWAKGEGKVDPEKIPRGAKFSADQWNVWQAWWTMRITFDALDKNNSMSLSKEDITKNKFHCDPDGKELWNAQEMSTGDDGMVGYDEYYSWWNMRQKFDQMDLDNSNTLDKPEMVKMAEGLGIVDFEVADMDLDTDGAVPFDEFVAWWRMRSMFMKFDKGNEGHLTRKEVQAMSRELGIQISVRSMDVDGDDCIDFAEYSAWWNMRHKFDKFDDDHSGELSYEEANLLGAQILGPDAEVDFKEMDDDNSGSVDFKEFTDWYKMRRCFEKIDISGDGTLDHDEIKRLAYMLNMDLKIEDIDKGGDGEVDFGEFQLWWGGNKTRAAIMSRVAMQMDRDKANAEEVEQTAPAIAWIAAAAVLTAIMIVPGFIYQLHTALTDPEALGLPPLGD